METQPPAPPPTKPPAKRRGRGEGGVGRRPDGSWYATVSLGTNPDGSRQRKYFYGASKSEVTKARSEWLVAHGSGFDPTNETVAQYLETFLKEIAPHATTNPAARVNTYSNYEWAIKKITPILGHVRVSELRAAHIDALLVKMREAKASAYSQNYALTVFKRALRKALKQDRLPKDPFVGIERPKHQKRDLTVWDEAQVARFLEVAEKESDRLYPLWFLALRGGMREGELLGLQWSDVDLEARQINVTAQLIERKGVIYGRQAPKSKAGTRTVYLSESVAGILRAQKARAAAEALASGKSAAPWVFPNRDGGPHHKANFWRFWKAAVTRAGLPYIRPHDMRHTKSTIAIRSGVDPKVLQEQLGHSDLKITLGTYYHPNEAQHRAAVERLESALGHEEGKK